jgi:membrane protein
VTTLPRNEAHDLAGRPDWRTIVGRIRDDLTEGRIVAIAAGVTFYNLLSVFPAIAALVALYGLVADPTTIAAHLDSLSNLVPDGMIDVVRGEINRISEQSGATKGIMVIVGFLVSVWSANGGVKALFDALNEVYGIKDERGFIKRNSISIAFVLGGLIVVLLAIGAVVVVPIVLNYIGIQGLAGAVVWIGRWPAVVIVVALLLALIYRYGPNRQSEHWRWITWGSALASISWLIASILFSWYAANFGSFNKTYGSLGAAIGFMIWMWISAIVVLVGAELDAILERRLPAA